MIQGICLAAETNLDEMYNRWDVTFKTAMAAIYIVIGFPSNIYCSSDS